MNYQLLKTTLLGDHPVTGVYNVDDALAAAEMAVVNCSQNRTSLSGDELFRATDSIEFVALTDHKRVLWVSFCSKDVDPFDSANVDFVQWIFGGGSDTVTNLNTERTATVAHWQLVGLDKEPNGDHIAHARSI